MANNNLLVEVPENVMFMHVLEKLYFNGNEVATFSEVRASTCISLACLLLTPRGRAHRGSAKASTISLARM